MVRISLRAAVFLICIAVSAASAAAPWPDPSGAICRVAIARGGAGVREAPDSGSEAVFNASEGAEHIAFRHVITHAGEAGDGSKWYELIGAFKWEWDEAEQTHKKVIAQSLEGRSAAGALLDQPLYVSVQDVREMPLRDGDADAVREWYERPSREPDAAEDTRGTERLWRAVGEYAGRWSLEAMAQRGGDVMIRTWYDSENEYHCSHLIGENVFVTYDPDDTIFIAAPGAELAGLVIGSSTEADARALLGDPTGDGEFEDGAFSREFYKLDLSGGVGVYGSEEIERTVSVRAARSLSYEEEESEGVYRFIYIFIGEDDRISAIETEYMNTIR